MSAMASWAKELRLHHWIKNLLVFFPALFAGLLFDPNIFVECSLAFIAFSFCASSVYILNDVRDLKKDRAHPEKRNRPIASGAVNAQAAKVVAIALFIAALAISSVPHVYVGVQLISLIPAWIVLISYWVLNILYSLSLKDVPIVDVAILAIGFMLRVELGGVLCGIETSNWLFLTVLSLALFFALGKRRGELLTVGCGSRSSLALYPVGFVSQLMYVMLSCGLIFYALWASQSSSSMMLYSVPLAIFACMRYSFVIEQDASSGDPVNVVIGDPPLLLLMIVWVFYACFCLYIF